RTLVFSARVTTALNAAKITITHPSVTARAANALMVDDLFVTDWRDQIASNIGTNSSLSTGTSPATTQGDELIIAAFGYEADAMSTPFVHGSLYTNTGPVIEGSGGSNPGGAVESGTGGGSD